MSGMWTSHNVNQLYNIVVDAQTSSSWDIRKLRKYLKKKHIYNIYYIFKKSLVSIQESEADENKLCTSNDWFW